MFEQKSNETITLTRTQLQTILDLISQIGGIGRSQSSDELKNHLKTDANNGNQFNYWDREKEDLLTKSDSELDERYSPFVMSNESQKSNRISSVSLSDCSKIDNQSVYSDAKSGTSNKSNFHRYIRSNDSEYDWNALYNKRMKALEYSRELALQLEDKLRLQIESNEKIKFEDQLLDKRIREQRLKMREEFESEHKLLEEKGVLAEKKREAVVEAIERTPIIKKRAFLSDMSPDSPFSVVSVAAVKPQTRTRETSAQTEQPNDCPQHREIGTQTDVQLLLHLLKEMNLINNHKLKSMSKSVDNLLTVPKSPVKKLVTKNISKSKIKTEIKSEEPKEKTSKRPVIRLNTQRLKTNDKSIKNSPLIREPQKENTAKRLTKSADKDINHLSDEEINDKSNDINILLNPNQTNPLNGENSSHNINQRIMSSIDPRIRINFLPEISGRPHTRKKWLSQQTFNPNFLN